MKKRSALSILVAAGLMLFNSCLFIAPALAGSLEPSQTPAEGSGMYSLDQIYNLADKGREPTVVSSFANPAASPASTMFSLYDLGNLMKTNFSACDAAAGDVLRGKVFFATQMTSDGTGAWGPTVGTYRPPAAATGNATVGDVLAGKTFSNSSSTGLTGTMPAVSLSPSLNAYPAGYHAGAASLTAVDSDLVAGNIADGVTIFGVEGTLAGGGGLLKTGQTAEYHSASLPYDLGDDGVLEKGTAFDYTDNGDNTVTDNVTGLMWIADHTAIDPAEAGGYDFAGTFVWDGAWGSPDAFSAIAALNAANYAGHDDWRLPNIRELESLVNRGTFDPAINTTYFPNTQSDYYWSSTTNADFSDLAWVVDFNGGDVVSGNKFNALYVRPVRAGE